MEAVDQGNGCLLSDFGFDVLAEGSRAQDAEILPFWLAALVGLDSSDQHVKPRLRSPYFSSRVREAISDIY